MYVELRGELERTDLTDYVVYITDVFTRTSSRYIQGAAFNVTYFESSITFIVHSNKHNWTRTSKSVSWIHKKPHVFNTTSWRYPPWQSRHCCHLPGTLATTRRSVLVNIRNLLTNCIFRAINPSAWGHLNPSSYCDVGRLFYGVFKLWSKLQRKKWRNNFLELSPTL